MTALDQEILRRRTFAIISHPDAGKTTLTEKLLLFGGAIQMAGTVKGRKAARHATSDWMRLEQQRGISITSSVMQFPYRDCIVNLLDTPGHEDFSEDTYRTLTAVDSALMVIDCAKGVEQRTIKLMEVCRLRDTPIMTFVNKLDRDGRAPIELLDEIEAVLKIHPAPITWPIGMGRELIGIYHLLEDRLYVYEAGLKGRVGGNRVIEGLASDDAHDLLGDQAARYAEEIALVRGATASFDVQQYRAGRLTPVFFGSAISNFGVEELLNAFVKHAPPPLARTCRERVVEPLEANLSGFVFKIQANMDAKHRDRIAFVRICSGTFEAGMDVTQVRTGEPMRLAAPQQFLARERVAIEKAWPGDVVGITDRGRLRIGDTLATRADVEFVGIPRFPPEHFARVVPTDPLRRKQFDTGLRQLTDEGAAQVFYASTEAGPQPIVGAVGMLQFDVMQYRLEHEYGAPCKFEPVRFKYPRWLTGPAAEVERVLDWHGHMRLYDTKGNPLVLFENEWALKSAINRDSNVVFHAVAP